MSDETASENVSADDPGATHPATSAESNGPIGGWHAPEPAAPILPHRVMTPINHNRIDYEPGTLFPAGLASEAELAELVRLGALQPDHLLRAQQAAADEIAAKNAEVEELRAQIARLQQEAQAKAARR